MTTQTDMGLRNYKLPDKYGAWLGYRVVSFDRDKHEAQLALDLRDDHLSPAGKIHGGVVSGFFDFACGAAVFSTMDPEDYCSTIELKVNYFFPLDAGDRLICHAKVLFRGKRLCTVQALLYRNQKAEPVAAAMATFNIVPKKKS